VSPYLINPCRHVALVAAALVLMACAGRPQNGNAAWLDDNAVVAIVFAGLWKVQLNCGDPSDGSF